MTADAVGGVWTYALELAHGLADRGVETVLAVLGPPPSEAQREDASRVPGLRLERHRGKLEWMPEPWDDVADAGRWLLGLADTYRPEVVHLNGYAHADLPWERPVLVAAHSCVASWWRAVHGVAVPAGWSRYCDAVRAGLDAADLVVAPTRAMLDALVREHGPVRRARVIPNGRSAEAFTPLAKQPKIVAAGRLWDEAKNLRALAAAAPHLPWPVALAGDARPPHGGEAPGFPNVELLGPQPPAAVARLFGEASIYALPALYEPFGLSVLEAALAGCALVLGDLASLRETWDGAAAFVDPRDVRSLAATLRELALRRRDRERLAAAARRRAFGLAPDRMTDAYLDAYAALLAAAGDATSPDALPDPATCASPSSAIH